MQTFTITKIQLEIIKKNQTKVSAFGTIFYKDGSELDQYDKHTTVETYFLSIPLQ
jgi:hypothetical protein